MSASLLTTRDVAALLGVSPGSIRLWAEKDWLLSHTTPGGHRRFLRRDVECFARERGLVLADAGPADLRVLVVDDDRHLADMVAESLRWSDQPVVVEIADDGFAAGQKIHAFQPHVVLLDLMMPGLDGFRTCGRIKREPATRQVRVVAMTGYYTQENARKALDSGADLCLAKPFSRAELFRAVGLDPPERVSAASPPESRP